MSYDLRVFLREPVAPERVAEALGAEVDGDELVIGDVATGVLTSGEIGLGVSGADSAGYAALLERVLALAEEAGARVYDPQAGVEITRANAAESLRAFG